MSERVMRHAAVLCSLGLVGVTGPRLGAQTAAQDDPVPFFRSQTRLVLEDVLVSDRQGNPRLACSDGTNLGHRGASRNIQ